MSRIFMFGILAILLVLHGVMGYAVNPKPPEPPKPPSQAEMADKAEKEKVASDKMMRDRQKMMERMMMRKRAETVKHRSEYEKKHPVNEPYIEWDWSKKRQDGDKGLVMLDEMDRKQKAAQAEAEKHRLSAPPPLLHPEATHSRPIAPP